MCRHRAEKASAGARGVPQMQESRSDPWVHSGNGRTGGPTAINRRAMLASRRRGHCEGAQPIGTGMHRLGFGSRTGILEPRQPRTRSRNETDPCGTPRRTAFGLGRRNVRRARGIGGIRPPIPQSWGTGSTRCHTARPSCKDEAAASRLVVQIRASSNPVRNQRNTWIHTEPHGWQRLLESRKV